MTTDADEDAANKTDAREDVPAVGNHDAKGGAGRCGVVRGNTKCIVLRVNSL